MEITVSGKQYEVATSLRVAYEMQKDFSKPYTAIFEGMQVSTLEDQIRIIHTAFRIKNPGVYDYKTFLEILLDTWELKDVLSTLNQIMKSITGVVDEQKE